MTEPVDATDESAEPTEDAGEPLPTVQPYPEGWHLVEAGSWQVSVAPDGLLMLPRHLHPREAEDFARAILAAADVGHAVVKANDAKTTPQPHVQSLETSTYVTHTAETTPGIKMLVRERAQTGHKSSIGRPKGGQSLDPRQPQPVAKPAPIAGPGARRGR